MKRKDLTSPLASMRRALAATYSVESATNQQLKLSHCEFARLGASSRCHMLSAKAELTSLSERLLIR